MNKEKIMELALAIDSEEKITSEIKVKKAEFELQNQELFDRQVSIRETISECKDILRENAEVGYNKDGIKKRLGGIGIRITKNIEYDEKIAFNWAKDHKLCLKLDASAFKKIAKTQDIEFVKINELVTVTFPSVIDLNEVNNNE